MNDVRLVATNPADSSLVPVATNARGELAVQSPKIEKVPNSLEVEGDLTAGSASFSGDVSMRASLLIKGGNGSGVFIRDKEDTEYTIDLNENGSAHFAGTVQVAGNPGSGGAVGSTVDSSGGFKAARTSGSQANFRGYLVGKESPTSQITADGSASFSGDVVIGSRSKQWMLVEQGGLCHMVEQARATTADLVTPPVYPKLRDVFAELDVVEKALEQVMEKLRMVEPDGWPVWDGSEV
jgi:hypothetical protein